MLERNCEQNGGFRNPAIEMHIAGDFDGIHRTQMSGQGVTGIIGLLFGAILRG
jgi:hypothetical protein